jgi:hypothetical protein
VNRTYSGSGFYGIETADGKIVYRAEQNDRQLLSAFPLRECVDGFIDFAARHASKAG